MQGLVRFGYIVISTACKSFVCNGVGQYPTSCNSPIAFTGISVSVCLPVGHSQLLQVLYPCSRLLPLLPDTTPTRVHQRLSQNNLRKRQISCEITAELSKWTNIVSKNYEPNRKNYAPDCARFCDGILHEKCLKIHANTENAVLFFCNGVVIDLLHFNSEKRRCQGHLKRIIVISLCWTQTQTMFGPFFFSERNFCWF